MKEFVGTITSSPGPMSSARSASEMASVPEETPTECSAPQYAANSASKAVELRAHREGTLAGDAAHDLEQLLEQDRVRLVQAGDRDGRKTRFG